MFHRTSFAIFTNFPRIQTIRKGRGELNIHRILFKTMSIQATIIHIDADLLTAVSNKTEKSCAINFKAKVVVSHYITVVFTVEVACVEK